MSKAQDDLLGQLRIERGAQPQQDAGGGRRWLWLAVLVALGLAAAWWFFGRTPAALMVRTASAVSAATAPRTASVLDASGYVVARRQATVSAKVTGKVLEVLIEEGMRVEEGQVLARLDDTQQQADLALRQSQLAAARSQVGEIDAQLRQARADLARQQELVARKLASAAQLDAARAQADTLSARLASQRRQIEVSQQALAVSQVALDDTVIRAPFAGIVIAKSAQPGEMISPVSAGGGFTRTGIGTVVDMDSLEVEVDVNEAFIGRVSNGMAVESSLNAYADWKIPGVVIAVIPAADRTKATVRVRVSLALKDPRIVPDMGVRVRFLEAGADATDAPVQALTGVLVPDSAVIAEAGAMIVYVVEENRARRRVVQSGALLGSMRNVTSGLNPGAVVVQTPPTGIADGALVRREEGS